MFKSFISALVPAIVLARGKNDGSSEENAITVTMMDIDGVQTFVHHWNALGSDGETWQLHGDTEIKFTQPKSKNLSYGFCLAQSTQNSSSYDCQQINVDISTNKYGVRSSNKYQFDVVDFNYRGDLGTFDFSSGNKDTNHRKNWKIDWANSYSDCVKAEEADKITCANGINLRWSRNFSTESGKEDIQLSLHDKGKERPIFSFAYEWAEPLWDKFNQSWPYGEPLKTTYSLASEKIRPVNFDLSKPERSAFEPVIEEDTATVWQELEQVIGGDSTSSQNQDGGNSQNQDGGNSQNQDGGDSQNQDGDNSQGKDEDSSQGTDQGDSGDQVIVGPEGIAPEKPEFEVETEDMDVSEGQTSSSDNQVDDSTGSNDGEDKTGGEGIDSGVKDLAATSQEIYDESMGWLYDNLWCVGIIYLVFGPLIAFFGGKWFPYITATLVGLFIVSGTCSIGLNAGWMASTGGSIAVLSVAIVLAVIAGCLVRKNFKLMLALLGLVAGFFGGSFLFALISGMTGGSWNDLWGYWVIACIAAIVGCVLALYIGMPLVLVSTSLVGSYLFMRSWTLFFPGSYPSEQALVSSKDEEELDMNSGFFWLYVGIFIVSFCISLTYQCKYGEEKVHEELKDHYSKQHA